MPERKTPEQRLIPVHCAFDEMQNVDAMVPNPRNPNEHSEQQIALLAKIIKGQGWRRPITVSKRSGFVVAGHARLSAALLLGTEQAPVDLQDYENEAAEWADLIADNRIAELAERNSVMLKDLMNELDSTDFDMDFTGFDDVAWEEMQKRFDGEKNSDRQEEIDEQYFILIECENEPEQVQKLTELTEAGYTCRALLS